IDDDRDGEDQADGDGVHARTAALPVLRQGLEELVHRVLCSAKEFEIHRAAGRASPPSARRTPEATPRLAGSNLGCACPGCNRPPAFAPQERPARAPSFLKWTVRGRFRGVGRWASVAAAHGPRTRLPQGAAPRAV